MKRSEMIYDLMMFAVQNNYFNVRDQYPDLIAKDIIKFLEERGMLPPEIIIGYSPLTTSNIWEKESK